MYIGLYEKAKEQAQANANRSQSPWQIFAYGQKWHCEPLSQGKVDGSEVVHPAQSTPPVQNQRSD